jgi:hypothetical protein
MLMFVGMGNPLGTRNLHGYGFGKNFIPVMGMGFLAGVFFLRGYEFGQVIPNGFLPVAISSDNRRGLARAGDDTMVHGSGSNRQPLSCCNDIVRPSEIVSVGGVMVPR